MEKEEVTYFRTLKWKRASEIYPNGFLWGDRIKAETIKQGQINNCYFITALSALAEQPGLLANVFITKERNKAGIYALRFYINGQSRIVVVDDYLPFNPNIDNSF